MHGIVEFLRIILPTLYALVEVNYLSLFFRDDPFARRAATPLLLVTVILHAVFVLSRSYLLHRYPISGPLEALSLIAFAVALVHVWIELTHKNQGAGVFIIGVVFVFQVISSAFMTGTEHTDVNPVLLSPWFIVHFGCAITGYSGFAVSAAYGLLFLLLYRDIKASRFGLVYERLPSLELLARMTIRAAVVGLVFLTLAILAGVGWSIWLEYSFLADPKFITTLVLWAVYGTCIGAHYLLKWPERRTVYFSLAGFVIMIFSMAAVHVVFRSFHRFT